MKVKLEEVVEALDFANEETQFLYDEKNEKIIMVYDGMVDGVKNPELIEEIEFGEYISLPENFEINEYQMMEEFILKLPRGNSQRVLAHAIQGKGAFRRFKDRLYDVGLVKEWYSFRDGAYEKLAREWCEEHNIEIIE